MRKEVILIHGYGEHAFRPQYEILLKVIKESGWQVTRHVIREHWDGNLRNTSYSYYFDNFQTILTDLLMEIERVRQKDDSECAIVLVGKSLGGLLAIRALEEAGDLAGAVALSPCLKIGCKYDSPLKRAIAYFLTDWLGLGWFYSPWDQLDPADVTRQVEEYITDTRILSQGIYAGVAVLTRNETFVAHSKKEMIRDPLLIVHGTDDQVCDPDSSVTFTRDLPDNCRTRLISGSVHDLLDEGQPIVDEVHREITQFLGEIEKQLEKAINAASITDSTGR